MTPLMGQLARQATSREPGTGFSVRRPIVILQSDDWGRVGVRDREGWDELEAAGIGLGNKPYDYYSLETAGDVTAVHEILSRHRDSVGRAPCLVMNFCLANLDFDKIHESNFETLYLHPLSQGLPGKWNRPGLIEAYREGIAAGIFYPALHGMTHFCRNALERHLVQHSARGVLLRTFLRAQTPYIHWRMPWVGFEYWDHDSKPQFIPAGGQRRFVAEAATEFSKVFGVRPLSACAPGYRANDDTRQSWAECGIQVAQNGPGKIIAPQMDDSGLLNTYRTVELEPALDESRYTVERCLEQASQCFARGIPAILSVHSINFHSTLKDFRGTTLARLDKFLSALERKYDDLLYAHDVDLLALLTTGKYEAGMQGQVSVRVEKSEASLMGGAGK